MARFGPIGNSDLSVIKFYLPSFAPTRGPICGFLFCFIAFLLILFIINAMRKSQKTGYRQCRLEAAVEKTALQIAHKFIYRYGRIADNRRSEKRQPDCCQLNFSPCSR